MKTMILIMTFAVILASAGNDLQAQSFKIKTDKSAVKWVGEKVTGFHNGEVKLLEGAITIDTGHITGKFVIDMTTISDFDLASPAMNEKLLAHLASDDFFSVQKFPEAVFVITNAQTRQYNEIDKFNYTITGNLSIKGVTNEISFPAFINYNKSKIIAIAKFSIDRTRWGLKYGSGDFFDSLGDKMIYNNIDFKIFLTGVK